MTNLANIKFFFLKKGVGWITNKTRTFCQKYWGITAENVYDEMENLKSRHSVVMFDGNMYLLYI